jgi:hypothetical protein
MLFYRGLSARVGSAPPPDGPLTVGIDGGFIRAPRKEGHFEVIAGKSMLSFRRHEDGDPRGACWHASSIFLEDDAAQTPNPIGRAMDKEAVEMPSHTDRHRKDSRR